MMISRETRLKNLRDMTPFQRLCHWINERETIRLAKEAGDPKPWTFDPILQTYRFCNVRRMDDKVSQWLLKNWYEPHFDHPNMLLACALARQLNNTDALQAVGFPKKWEPAKLQKILEDRATAGHKNYSAAYMITSNYGERGRAPESKPYQTMFRVCDPVYQAKNVSKSLRIDTDSMQKTWKKLLAFQGFSGFIAGQVVADLRWAISGSWLDKIAWAPMGPGSKRGMNRLLERGVHDPLSQEEFLENLQDMIAECHKVLPASITDRLEAIDWQNCLCEYDKHSRVLFGEGTPKQKYPGE